MENELLISWLEGAIEQCRDNMREWTKMGLSPMSSMSYRTEQKSKIEAYQNVITKLKSGVIIIQNTESPTDVMGTLNVEQLP